MLHKKIIILKSTESGKIIGSAVCYLSQNGIGANIKAEKYRDGYLILESDAIPVTAVKGGKVQASDVSPQDFSHGFTAVLAELKSGKLSVVAHGTSGAAPSGITVDGLLRRAQRRFAGGVFIPDQKGSDYGGKFSPPAPAEKNDGNMAHGNYQKTQGDIQKAQGNYQKAQGDIPKAQGNYQKAQGDIPKAHGNYQKAQGDTQKAHDNYQKTQGGGAVAMSKDKDSENKAAHSAEKDIKAGSPQKLNEKAWQDYAQDLAGDKFLFEDTTLADPDLIAEENYFMFDSAGKSGKKEPPPENITDGYFHIPPPEKCSDTAIPQSMRDMFNKDCVRRNAVDKDSAGRAMTGNHNTAGRAMTDNHNTASRAISDKAGYSGSRDTAIGGGESHIHKIKINKDYVRGEQRMRYYNSIKDSITQLLKNNQKETSLNNILPDSEFVRVYYADDKYYCVGLVREQDLPIYICYGVFSEQYRDAPTQFEGKSRFIPISHLQPKGNGYFMLFQSVDDGSIIDTKSGQ